MKAPSNLQLTALACLSRSPKQRKTQYELMIDINHITELIDAPYSPGTIYPSLKALSQTKMININQGGCLIESAGYELLENALLTQPLPTSLIGNLHRLLLANILPDKAVKAAAVKRIDIELIKFNHNHQEKGQLSGANPLLPVSARQHIVTCIRRIAVDIVA